MEQQSATFANSFWGEQDRGLEVLSARMKQGKHITEEVHTLFKERAAIEEEYGRRLAKLAKNFNVKEELGTMRDALDSTRNELEKSARIHLELANDLKVKLERPMQDFLATQSTIRKNHQKVLEKHLQAKAIQEAMVLRAKDRYESKSMEASQLQQASRHGIPSRETEKLRIRSERLSLQAKQADQEYLSACDRLTEIHRTWKGDMYAACIDYQKLEEDRFHFLRGNLWNYANFVSGGCVLDDESCERIRISLEKCDFAADLKLFLESSATGRDIPIPMSYVPFNDVMGRNNQSKDTFSDFSRNSTQQVVQDLAIAESRNFGIPSTAPFVTAASDNYQRFNSKSNFDANPATEPPIICTVRVLYNYQSQAPEELSITKGQIIPVTATHEDGWWEGLATENSRRRKGLFPSNFTEQIR